VTKLPWADFSGDLNRNAAGLSGAAVFVHPDHPDFSTHLDDTALRLARGGLAGSHAANVRRRQICGLPLPTLDSSRSAGSRRKSKRRMKRIVKQPLFDRKRGSKSAVSAWP